MSVKDIKVFGLILWDHRKQLVRILVQDLSSSIANEKRNNNCESSKLVCNFYKPLSTINALTRAVQRVYLKNVRTFFHVPQSIIDCFLLCLWVSDGKCVCVCVCRIFCFTRSWLRLMPRRQFVHVMWPIYLNQHGKKMASIKPTDCLHPRIMTDSMYACANANRLICDKSDIIFVFAVKCHWQW